VVDDIWYIHTNLISLDSEGATMIFKCLSNAKCGKQPRDTPVSNPIECSLDRFHIVSLVIVSHRNDTRTQ
jgi:hypothetical protein